MKRRYQDQPLSCPGLRFRPCLPAWLAGLLAAACVGAMAAAAAEPAQPSAQGEASAPQPDQSLTETGSARASASTQAEAPAQRLQRSPAPAHPSDFSDTAKWTRYVVGTGVQVTPSGNGFDVEYSAEAGGADVLSGAYVSTFALRGDFTVDIDYTLKTWPAANGVRLGLGVRPYFSAHRASTQESGETYSFAMRPVGSSDVLTDDQRGSLRIARRGETISGYYRSSPNGEWVLLGSRSAEPALQKELQIHVESWTGNFFGGKAVALRLGNLTMSADRVLPGPYGVPSWAVAAPGPRLITGPSANPAVPPYGNVVVMEGPPPGTGAWVPSAEPPIAPRPGGRIGPAPRPGPFGLRPATQGETLAPQREKGPSLVSNLSDFTDAARWTLSITGKGVRVTSSGNGFDVDYAADAGGEDVLGAEYVSTFALHGDFTMDLDYTLKRWPAANGVRLGMGLRPFVGVHRASTPEWGETYTFIVGAPSNVPTEDQRGTLRLVRKGGTLTGYYRSAPDRDWVLIGSRSDDPVIQEDLQAHLATWTGNGFGGQAIGVRFSNFALKADTLLPGPYAVPVWPGLPPAVQPNVQAAEPAAQPASAKNAPLPSTMSDFADTANWSRRVSGTGIRLRPSGNGFEIDYSAEARPDSAGMVAGYTSTFALRGDFTLDVDYTLKEWPPVSGVRLGLGVWPSICTIREALPELGDAYTFGAGPYEHIPTGDRHGSLRLVRTGGTLAGYYRSSHSSPWVRIGSRSDNPVFLNDFQVSVASWTSEDAFARQPVAITLDNLAMTADTVLPGPYGVPPPGFEGLGPLLAQEPAPAPAPMPANRLSPRPRPLREEALAPGILEEDLDLDLAAAVQFYQTLINQFDAQRPVAANAIFRLGECYRRLGRTDDARSQYDRILREFSDQAVLVRLSQRYARVPATPGPRRAAEVGTPGAGASFTDRLRNIMNSADRPGPGAPPATALPPADSQRRRGGEGGEARPPELNRPGGPGSSRGYRLDAGDTGAAAQPHPMDEIDTLGWQLAQARNELLKAKSSVADGKAKVSAAEAKLKFVGQDDAAVPQAKAAVEHAMAALDLARGQAALWSDEVTRLEGTLKERQRHRETVARLNYEQADTDFKRLKAAYDTHAIPQVQYEEAKIAREKAAADYSAAAPTGTSPQP